MSVIVQIPSALRHECGGVTELSLVAATVREALDVLEANHSALYRSVCDETGNVRQHVNLFVNDAFVLKRQGLDAPLSDGDVLTIMPAVSGG